MSEKQDCDDVPEFGTISVATAEERARWAKAFGVSEATLLRAVKLVGTSIKELRKLFCRD
jgi:hypothetical protein